MEPAEARALVKDKTDKDSTVRHLISVEGVMRALARRLGEDEHRWALAGQARSRDLPAAGRHGVAGGSGEGHWPFWSYGAG